MSIDAGKTNPPGFTAGEAYLRAIFETEPECVKLLAADGSLLDMNPAGLRMLEADSLAQVKGQCVFPLIADDHRVAFRELGERIFRGESGMLEFQMIGLKGTQRWLETHASPLRDASGKIIALLGVTRDVTARRQSEELLDGQRHVFEMIATGAPLEDSLAALVRLLEAQAPEMLCSVLLVDAERIRLRYGAAPSLPPEYNCAIDGETIAPDAGTCGAAAYRREMVIVEDIATDPLWANHRPFALEHGLRACWSVPILNAQRAVLGTFAVYYRESRKPNERHQQLVNVATHVAAIAIGRQREENALRLSELRLAAFSSLGEKLSSTKTAEEAGEIIVQVADDLFGWDACTIRLYSSEKDDLTHVLSYDIINGERMKVQGVNEREAPSPRTRRVFAHGAELVLREPPFVMTDSVAFGDKSRPSASLMIVPIRHTARVIGVLSIQSYTPRAYTKQDLDALQSLADHCGGALNRIQAEEAFHVSEGQFRSVWERSVDGMRLTDSQGHVIAVNEAFCKMVELPREKLLGKIFTTTYDEPSPMEGLALYRRRFDTGEIVARLTARVRLWNLKERDLEISNSFIEFGPQGRLLLSIFRDITEQRRIEEQFRQSQKMEAFGQLAGGVAHDFNNILGVIMGYTNLLMHDQSMKPEVRKQLNEIFLAGERAANLTRQLLTFSRKKAVQVRPLDLNGIIGNITQMLGRVIGEHIKLQCNFASSLPLIQADDGMLEQVLMNLAVNARDAMTEGGQLTISTERASVGAGAGGNSRPGDYVLLTVRDTGCGMTPEVKARIFEPFFTTKGVGRGTGLGLATVYGIVEQHNGWIDVESHTGSGSTFKVYLPIVRSSETPNTGRTADAKTLGGNEIILLVEDEVPLRALTRTVLKKQGYQVIEATSGLDAVGVWDRHAGEFDLLLTDMVMPDGVTGRELAQKLRAQKPDLKVIFTSGYNPDMAGADTAFIRQTKGQFLQKPYTPEALLRVVREALDRESQ